MSRIASLTFSIVAATAVPAFADDQTPRPKKFAFWGGMEINAGSKSLSIAPPQSNSDVSEQPTRAEIAFESKLAAGTILVKTAERKLYFIEPGNRAIVWRVAVGREGFSWRGSKAISRMAEWPAWRPPTEMLAREASNGHIIPDFVKGGPGNPLGARALYLGDTAYRIHGTDKPWTIGQASSSGCIRMMNADVEELYKLAKIGTKVIVE